MVPCVKLDLGLVTDGLDLLLVCEGDIQFFALFFHRLAIFFVEL